MSSNSRSVGESSSAIMCFFFQAGDGIGDIGVTGVQTCALPIYEQVDAKERARVELAEARQRLIDLSRRSGMAEIATSVLHNVGNVLNSVSVSATLGADKVKDSRVDKLAAVVGMFQE